MQIFFGGVPDVGLLEGLGGWCINEQSPHRLMGRLLVKRLCGPLEFLFQLLDVGCLFHVHFVAVLVIEMVFKIGQFLVGDDSYSQSVLHLPFTVE